MPDPDSRAGRLTVGSALLLALAAVALPLRPWDTGPEVEPAVLCVPAIEATWYGTPAGSGAARIGDLGGGWEAVGPFELAERSDGSAFLSGSFRDGPAGDAFLDLEVKLYHASTGSEREPGAAPSGYRAIRGVLRGAGRYDGLLLRVSNSEAVAFTVDGSDGVAQLRFDLEWIQTPDGLEDEWSNQGQLAELELTFGDRHVARASDASLVLGSVEGELQLVAGGTFVEHSNGTAELEALVARRGHPRQRYQLQLELCDVNARGDYTSCTGALLGIDDLAGARVSLRGVRAGFLVAPWRSEGMPRSALLASLASRVETLPDHPHHGLRKGEHEGTLSVRLEGGGLHFAHGGALAGEGWRDGYVAELGALGQDYVFEAGGELSESASGRARLSGVLVRRSAPDEAFFLELDLQRRGFESHPFPGAEDLGHSTSWHGYALEGGALHGLREHHGRTLELTDRGDLLRVGLGAGDGATTYGASGSFGLREAGELSALDRLGSPERVELSFDLAHASEASAAVVSHPGGFVLEHLGSDFVFASDGRLRQDRDGSARLSGILARRNFPRQRFFLELELEGRSEPGTAHHPPPGSPSSRFDEGAPRAFAGQAATWSYFTGLEGSLVGLDDYDGARLALSRRGPGLQLGLGAAGEADAFGACASFGVEVLAQPRGRLRILDRTRAGELSLRLRRGASDEVRSAFALPSVRSSSSAALLLPGVADDLTFVQPGLFREFPGGRACLEGRLQSASEPGLGFDLRIDFEERLEGGALEASDLRLPSNAYADRGGPVETELWHFYRRASGLLVGTGELAGAVIEVESRHRALQVGLGANGRNLEFGATGALELEPLSGPVGSSAWLPDYFPACELHVDLSAGE